MKENPRRRGYCKTCAYIESHPKCGLNMMLADGQPYGVVADRFKGKAGSLRTIKRHWDAQHKVHRQLLQAKATKDAKKGLELLECQQKVWDDAQEAIDLSLGRKAPPKNPYNLAVFGQCIAPQVKIIEVLAKVSPGDLQDTESDGFLEALKANANNDWKKTRPIQMATTEPETAASDELVDD